MSTGSNFPQGQGMKNKGQEVGHKIQDTAQSTGHKLQDTAQSLGHKAQDTAQSVGHKIQDTAQSLGHKAQDTAANLGQKAKDAGTSVLDRTDDTLSTVGEKISALGGSLRESAPREGRLGSAASTVAENLEAGGRYLQEHGLEDIGEDMTNMVRRYPMQSVLIGFGIGCLLGMAFSRR